MSSPKQTVAQKRNIGIAESSHKPHKKRSKAKKCTPEESRQESEDNEFQPKKSKPKKPKRLKSKPSKLQSDQKSEKEETSKDGKKLKKEQENEIKNPELAAVLKKELFQDSLQASSYEAMAAMLKECMLGQRWDEAARLLSTMSLYHMIDTDYQWKCGTCVMAHHPKGSKELNENLLSAVFKSKTSNQSKKKLEHAFYLLSQGLIEEAHQVITKIHFFPGKHCDWDVTTGKYWEDVSVAYTGLIEYCMWLQKHGANGTQDHNEKRGDSLTTSKHCSGAVQKLGTITQQPGVWDIFITKQVEILTILGQIERAEEVLKTYHKNNPGNPNSHVYLYEFLKEHHSKDVNQRLEVLKKLTDILPAEQYVLEYVSLLESTKSSSVAVDALPVLFNMVDYSAWHANVLPWKTLLKYVMSTLKSGSKDGLRVLQGCWQCRKSWWPRYHFNQQEVLQLVKLNRDLICKKAILASIFLEPKCPFVEKVRKSLEKKHSKALKKLNDDISKLTSLVYDLEARKQILFC